MWVSGEVERLHPSRRGHLYFELVEKGAGDEIAAKIDAVLWRSDFERVRRLLAASGQELAPGVAVRCRGNVDFYPGGGRLQLVVRDVDPAFTLGLWAVRRAETLRALADGGLLERNRGLPFPELPLRVALITSQGSAAYHDFLASLGESGYGFRVLFLHAAVQGRQAEREVTSALTAAGGAGVDCIALVRGGGSRTDLAVFDGRVIAEAVALSPVPVITGLGHEIDESIADRVAHTAVKTPTKAAELLIESVARRELDLLAVERALRREAHEPLRRAREALGRAERGLAFGRHRLAAAGERADQLGGALARLARTRLAHAGREERELGRRLGAAAPRRVSAAGELRRALAARLVAAGGGRLREATATLLGLRRLTAELAPERTLARGYSVTRDGHGALLRAADQVAAGERIATRLARGDLISRVEEA